MHSESSRNESSPLIAATSATGQVTGRQTADVRSLVDQGLIETRTIMINNTPERVVVLTTEGRDLLEAHREPREDRDRPDQRYYAGLVKPRELAHDAQLYRMFEIERERLEAEGARIARVVLDYELKSEYHAFVHAQRQAGVSASDARREFADTHDLPFRRRHIALPDVRIEYDSPDGERLHRDLEFADRALLALPDEWQAGRRLPRLPRHRRAPVWGRQGRGESTRPTPSGLASLTAEGPSPWAMTRVRPGGPVLRIRGGVAGRRPCARSGVFRKAYGIP